MSLPTNQCWRTESWTLSQSLGTAATDANQPCRVQISYVRFHHRRSVAVVFRPGGSAGRSLKIGPAPNLRPGVPDCRDQSGTHYIASSNRVFSSGSQTNPATTGRPHPPR
jgi:hypothetical protein